MSLDLSADRSAHRFDAAGAPAAVLAIFTATIFLSAALLFSVQPMFAKMVLPRLGGSPAVWSVAMVFFQALLLLGYLYAHVLARCLSARSAALVQVCLIGATTVLTLPIAVTEALGRAPADHEAFWLLGIFAVSVGLPFFAVAGNAPLLQRWFSRSGHPHAADPYFLYGASNLGSLAALLAYPTIIEPLLPLGAQAWWWSAGLIALAAGIVLCATVSTGTHEAPRAAPVTSAPASLRRRLGWIGFAFVPSGLLVAVTAQISTDIASAPFLWIVPLSLFLLTFVATFRDRPLVPHRIVTAAWPLLAALVCAGYAWFGSLGLWGLALTLGSFLVAALLCHGELYRSRPAADRLTEFYLWTSLGGVLGGLFAGLLSPLIFDGVYEYPILIVLALACTPAVARPTMQRWAVEVAVLAGIVAIVALVWPLLRPVVDVRLAAFLIAGVGASAIWLERRAPLRSAAVAAAMLAMMGVVAGGATELSVRSFFGVSRIKLSEDGRFRDFIHGTTVHGTTRLRAADGTPVDGRPEPLAYYSFGGGIDQAVKAVRTVHGGRLARVGVAGLGTGALACHAQAGEAWSFFEIDPAVIRIARDPRWFRFLSECAPDARVIAGDARLTLADEAQADDVLILDAFSSDSIPMHLLTVEAFQSYLARLAPDGAIVLNTSNRYFDITAIVAAAAERLHLVGAHLPRAASIKQAEALPERSFPTEVVVLARRPDVLAGLLAKPGWQPLKTGDEAAWTDDYSNILGALWRRL